MGLMIRGKQATFVLDKVGPIKDLFIVLFFVSMGTLINIGTVLTLTLPIIAVIGMAIVGKFGGCWIGAKLSAVRHDATKVGISMLPRGEFSFIVASEGDRPRSRVSTTLPSCWTHHTDHVNSFVNCHETPEQAQ